MRNTFHRANYGGQQLIWRNSVLSTVSKSEDDKTRRNQSHFRIFDNGRSYTFLAAGLCCWVVLWKVQVVLHLRSEIPFLETGWLLFINGSYLGGLGDLLAVDETSKAASEMRKRKSLLLLFGCWNPVGHVGSRRSSYNLNICIRLWFSEKAKQKFQKQFFEILTCSFFS